MRSRRVTAGRAALSTSTAADGVRHTMWRVERRAIAMRSCAAFARVPALYIADGHHRAASAARAQGRISRPRTTRPSLGDGADYKTFLGVAFPHDQVRILPYNRIVKDLGSRSTPDEFLEAVQERFDVEAGPAVARQRGEIAMYFGGRWYTLRPRSTPGRADAIGSLDVSVLQEQLLTPVLGITDVTHRQADRFRRRRPRHRRARDAGRFRARRPSHFRCSPSASPI